MGENIQFGYFFSILDIFKRFLFVNKAKKEIKVRKKQTTKEGGGGKRRKGERWEAGNGGMRRRGVGKKGSGLYYTQFSSFS